MTIRPATPDDLPFVKAMQFETFFWNPNTPRPPADAFLAKPEIQRILAGWGRPGDRAVIASGTSWIFLLQI